MPETGPKPDIPQVEDKRPTIAGLLPKNTQSRVLVGIALLMVTIIMLSGRNTPKQPVAPAPSPTTAVEDPNQARIQEYRARIEEQTRKLAAEEAQLAQTKQAFGMPGRESGLAATASASGNGASIDSSAQQNQSWIETDRLKREYQSLFASNIALSHREGADERSAPAKPPAAEPHLPNPLRPQPGSTDTVKGHRLFEGTVIETVLTNRLDGSFSGPVNCLVTTQVYSHDRQHPLIPQGTRILGEVRKLESFGQQRLAVFFHRMIMPDGYSISLDQFQGLNQIGETGLRDQVNNHYLQIFGVSLAIGAVAGLSQANTRYGLDESAADAYRQGVAASLSQTSMHILDRYLNVLPTFTIREGHRVKVYLSGDLVLPAYDQHQSPVDL